MQEYAHGGVQGGGYGGCTGGGLRGAGGDFVLIMGALCWACQSPKKTSQLPDVPRVMQTWQKPYVRRPWAML